MARLLLLLLLPICEAEDSACRACDWTRRRAALVPAVGRARAECRAARSRNWRRPRTGSASRASSRQRSSPDGRVSGQKPAARRTASAPARLRCRGGRCCRARARHIEAKACRAACAAPRPGTHPGVVRPPAQSNGYSAAQRVPTVPTYSVGVIGARGFALAIIVGALAGRVVAARHSRQRARSVHLRARCGSSCSRSVLWRKVRLWSETQKSHP